MSRPTTGEHSTDTVLGSATTAQEAGFDVAAWAREACEASGVPFAVEDPVALAKLRDLAEHPA